MLPVVALSLHQSAGIRQARVDGPLDALRRLPGVCCQWESGNITIAPGTPAGVVVLHRLFVEPPLWQGLQSLLAKGWIITSDIDDDPGAWGGFAANDNLAFRGVHAVTVSTEPLAGLISQFNPNVYVLPNAVTALLPAAPTVPKRSGMLRLFFGALNRNADWQPIVHSVNEALCELTHKGYLVQMVVVHDREFYEAISEQVAKEFHPTLEHEQYLQVLSSCDLALLPLLDTPFNRLKSDLKFIECCAAGVVALCSDVVYADQPEHRHIGVFPAPDQWGKALLDLCPNTHEIAQRRIAGMRYVAAQRLHEQQAPKRFALYKSLQQNRQTLEVQRLERMKTVL